MWISQRSLSLIYELLTCATVPNCTCFLEVRMYLISRNVVSICSVRLPLELYKDKNSFIMPYYGLFWTRSPYLDLRWRSRSTGTIPELLITSIVRHKNKNRWVGDPMWRSCSLFCVVIFYSSFGLVKYPYTKQFHMISTGDPPFTMFLLYDLLWDIVPVCLYTRICEISNKTTPM